MITNKDLEIENISYTNKDFGQIYPELIELVKKLTNAYDPAATNESDPGIVLLKMVAFIGDKLNYNIDKNTLEQFIVSATQETSMRRLTEMMGYNMKYYRSATTKIGFRYLGQLDVDSSATSTDSEDTSSESLTLSAYDSFYIKAFDTTFKTDEDTVYTLLEDIYVTANNKQCTDKLAIQGSLKELSVLGSDDYSESTLIQLYNLDSQNRVYFPDVEVAENGIFINKEVYDALHNNSAWHRVNNLNDQELGSKVFKFGFDSDKGYPYLEFPKDIASLIEDGLEIWYIVSSGESGTVANNKLTSFDKIKIVDSSDSSATEIVSSLDESLYVLSNSASTEASNPESLTEAYNNFKKVVGTFDTLVSCKDYSNYINRYVDDESNKVVSNVVITDLRTDPEYSKTTFIRDTTASSYYKNIVTDGSSPFNIIAHGVGPLNQTIQNINQYEKTYTQIGDTDIKNISNVIDDVKTINHVLTKPADKTLNIIEADYTLKAVISTKYKVNKTEQEEIIKAIKVALAQNFSADKVDFGEEIPFDSLLEVIGNADTRIKNVSLDNPDVSYYVSNMGEEKKAYDPNTHLEIIFNNVLAGALPLYGEDTSFNYDYNMNLEDVTTTSNLCAIDASIDIEAGHTLQENESLQLVEDSYITQVTYPAYVYYAFTGSGTVGEIAIHADQTYKLQENEILYINYTDSSDVKQFIKYEAGSIIKPNFDIVNTNGSARITGDVDVDNKTASKFVNWAQRKVLSDVTVNNYDPSDGTIALFSIGTNEQIEILKRHEITLETNSPIFWYIKPRVDSSLTGNPVVNEEGALLFQENPYSGKKYYILEEGELFIYPNDDMTTLNILGAGTRIEFEDNQINRSSSDIIDLDELENSIEDEDVGTFRKSFNWEYANKPITIIETVVSTYITDDVVTSFELNSGDKITKAWTPITVLNINENDVTVSADARPLIRSVLSITSSSSEPQKVLSGQTVTLYKSDVAEETSSKTATITSETIEAEKYIQLSPSTDSYNDLCVLQTIRYDGDESSLTPLKDDNGNYLHSFDYSALIYKEKASTTYEAKLTDLVAWAVANNKYWTTSRDEYAINQTDVKAFWENHGKTALEVKAGVEDLYFNVFDTYSGNTQLLENGDTLDLEAFCIDGAEKVLYITKPKVLKLYNYLVNGLTADNQKALLQQLKNYTQFDYIGPKNTSKIIDSYDPLYSFFDSNNLYNKFTLAKLDFKNSEFNIAGSSKS